MCSPAHRSAAITKTGAAARADPMPAGPHHWPSIPSSSQRALPLVAFEPYLRRPRDLRGSRSGRGSVFFLFLSRPPTFRRDLPRDLDLVLYLKLFQILDKDKEV